MHGSGGVEQVGCQADVSRLIEMVVGDKGDDRATTGGADRRKVKRGGGEVGDGAVETKDSSAPA